MTQEQKELLLKDLCARLPYRVKVHTPLKPICSIYSKPTIYSTVVIDGAGEEVCNISDIKPYLLPLSSMAEEQFEELKVFADLIYEGNTLELVEWNDNCKTLEFWLEEIPSHCVIKVFDWLNKNHFDYRGLIPMGIAIDATGLNIY